MHPTRRPTHRFGIASAFVAALVASLAVMAGPASAVPITVNGTATPGHAIFAEPGVGTNGSDDPAILNHLKWLIDNTPCPTPTAPTVQAIRAAINSIGNTSAALPTAIRNSLDTKENCGVDVRVIVNGSAKGTDSAEALRTQLGTDDFEWCDHGNTSLYGNGCVSTHVGSSDPGDDGGMHSKYFLFSYAGASCVTWFGSANLTQATGTQTFNNGVTLYNNCSLYETFRNEIWEPAWEENSFADNDFYAPSLGRGYFIHGSPSLTFHASPENTQPTANDYVLGMLDSVSAGTGCEVLVANAEWTGRLYPSKSPPQDEAIAKRLAQLKNNGCAVGVIVGNDNDGTANIASGTNSPRQVLQNAGIAIEHGPVHDKYFVIDGPGQPKAVITGSHNLTTGAWRHNDELFVKIANSPSTHKAYRDHWFATGFAASVCGKLDSTCP